MWDVLITLGTASFIPGLMPTVFNPRAYVPRATSAVSVFGLTVVIIGLIGSGLVASPIMSTVTALIWVYIFLYRGRTIDS